MKSRFHTLDSLRGIAALQVVIGHSLVALSTLIWLVYVPDKEIVHDLNFYLFFTPVHFFYAATEAVKIFFVLSGFVLAIPFYQKRNVRFDYVNFFFKRILRLYLPCLAVILLSIGLSKLLYHPILNHSYSDWVRNIWSKKESTSEIFGLIFLSPPSDFNNNNIALWTLPPEIKLSLILPFFVLLQRKSKIWLNILMVVTFIISLSLLKKIGVSDFTTLYYFTFFIIGALLCKHKERLIYFIDNLTNIQFTIFIVIALVAYTFQYTLWWLPEKILFYLKKYQDYVSCFASVLFVILALSKRCKFLLSLAFFQFIGKISFSLYLVHIVVITSIVHIAHGILNPYCVILLGFTLSFPTAYLFYIFIELPSIKIAKRIADWIQAFVFKNRKLPL